MPVFEEQTRTVSQTIKDTPSPAL